MRTGFCGRPAAHKEHAMSLDPKSVHVRLSPDMYGRLTVLAGLDDREVSAHAAYLLEKSIVGEFHAVNVQVNRIKRLGLLGPDRDAKVPAVPGRD
jgi:hypothetical protein